MLYYAVPIKSSENNAYIMVRYLQGYWELDNKAIEMDILQPIGLRFELIPSTLPTLLCTESTFSFSFRIWIIYFFRSDSRGRGVTLVIFLSS